MRGRASGATRRARRKRGFALILALLTLSILAVVVTQFSYSCKIENRIVQNGLDDEQLTVASRGAIAYVGALFRDDDKNGKTPQGVDSLADCWNDPHLTELLQVKLGDTATLQLTIEDLDRRLSLDWFTKDDRQAFMTTALKRLLDKLNPDGDHQKTADAIRDQVRKIAGLAAVQDTNPAAGQQPPPPQPQPQPQPNLPNGQAPPPKRGILDIDQLLDIEVEGVDMKKVIWGDPTQNPPKVGIAQFVTCWCTDTINVNTAPGEVLYAILPNQNADTPPKNLWDEGSAKQVTDGIQKRRIDPFFEQEQTQQNGGSQGTAPPPPQPQPATGGQQNGSGNGASKSWQGQPYEKVDDLKDQPLLATFFGGSATTAAGGGQPQPAPQPAPNPATQGAQPFGFKTALAVASRYYAVVVKAQNAGGATKTVRMVVARSTSNEVTPLLIREDPR
jgi:type II secretory pathway component PulK